MPVRAQLLRPDDLLNLEIEGVNLRIETTNADEPALLVDNPAQPAFLAPGTKADAAGRAAVLIGFFGSDCDVSKLTERDQREFARQRLQGGIEYEGSNRERLRTRPVRVRSVEADLVLLHAMLK